MDEFMEQVKETAYRIKDEVTRAGKQLYDKTNSVIGQTKLSYAISETEKKIKEVHAEMGKRIYEQYLATGEKPELLSEECEKLEALYKEKEALKEKMSELKLSVICPECGKYNKADAAYCNKCGAKLDDDKTGESVYVYEETGDEGDEDETAEEGVNEDTAEPVVEDEAEADEAADENDEIKEEIKEAAEDIKENLTDAAQTVKKTVKRVISIKAKKPEDND